MSAATPGPWFVEACSLRDEPGEGDALNGVSAKGRPYLAKCLRWGAERATDEDEANATLIASAPEQQAKIDLLGNALRTVRGHCGTCDDCDKAIDEALRAIGRIP